MDKATLTTTSLTYALAPAPSTTTATAAPIPTPVTFTQACMTDPAAAKPSFGVYIKTGLALAVSFMAVMFY
jgi:hypothetical protein